MSVGSEGGVVRVVARAPAKVNVQLSVGRREDDGYHPLATVFQAVSLWETVIAEPREDGDVTVSVELQPTVTCDPGSIPLDESNLAVRAARAVAERFGIERGVDLTILKAIPVAGGMAGGSADAAAALVACAEAWETGATRAELDALAAPLGSDVPFALHGHTAVGQGRGDLLTPAMTRGEFHWVIATQDAGLSTAEVYAAYDASIAEGRRLPREPIIDEVLMAALRAGDATALGPCLSNDLEEAALGLAPHLRATLEAALDAGALAAIVSGSGPSIAALARSAQHALVVAAGIIASGTSGPVVTATGPAGGTAVVDILRS